MTGSASHFNFFLACLLVLSTTGCVSLLMSWWGQNVMARQIGWVTFYLAALLAAWNMYSIEWSGNGGTVLIGAVIWTTVSICIYRYIHSIPCD